MINCIVCGKLITKKISTKKRSVVSLPITFYFLLYNFFLLLNFLNFPSCYILFMSFCFPYLASHFLVVDMAYLTKLSILTKKWRVIINVVTIHKIPHGRLLRIDHIIRIILKAPISLLLKTKP